MESTELEIETPPPASIGGEIDDSVMKETRSYSFIINWLIHVLSYYNL